MRVMYAHLRVHARRPREDRLQAEEDGVRGHDGERSKHRGYRAASFDVRALRLPPRKTRPLQPAVHPGKSQRRAVGDASDWLEPQLHVQASSAVTDLYP